MAAGLPSRRPLFEPRVRPVGSRRQRLAVEALRDRAEDREVPPDQVAALLPEDLLELPEQLALPVRVQLGEDLVEEALRAWVAPVRLGIVRVLHLVLRVVGD